ncbi:hypothetical protein HK097_007618 [Rhizophlyctis rosea]|uniref:Uncharacterized protein n=1 Tax=Rhizophlyctis rosea TaxID=64517 RepID=A0AAD5SEH3_9FUNG|nr:hypothetical protein HK097_007618 [Rhizophlyctis rosea]
MSQFKFTPTHESILAAREQEVQAQSHQHKGASHWPERDTRVLIALICKLDQTHSHQQIAEEYLKNYVLPAGDWHPGVQVVIDKIKNEKKSLRKAAKAEE